MKKDDLIKPLKWQSAEWADWYLVKQRDGLRWIEYAYGEAQTNFTQVSVNYDVNGRLEVILIRQGGGLLKKLTNRYLYVGKNLTWIEKALTSGYWEKKGYEINFEFKDPRSNFFCKLIF